MTYPIILSDKFELERFIGTICRHTAKMTANQVLLQTGQIKPMMKLSECYRMLSRRKVDKAIEEHKLKCIKKGSNTLIKREDFEYYLNKHDFEL
jgi:excisionase family DNA binding protein